MDGRGFWFGVGGGLIAAFVWVAVNRSEPVLAQTVGGAGPVPVVHDGVDGQQSVYLWDAHTQTLCVYQFDPRRGKLKLGAARHVGADQRLLEFNNEEPHVADIEKLARSK